MKIVLDGLPDPTVSVARFRAELPGADLRSFLRRRVISAPAYVYPDPDHQYALCEAIGDLLACHPANVLLVGSAKLGFSTAPHKRYRHFGDKSDLDAVVVDERLFDRIWDEVQKAVEDRLEWRRRRDFADYLMRGWIRPDMFPDVDGPVIGDWWDGFRIISRNVGIKVAGAVYRTWPFLEAYQLASLRACREAEMLAPAANASEVVV